MLRRTLLPTLAALACGVSLPARAEDGVAVIGHAALRGLDAATVTRIYTGRIIEVNGVAVTAINAEISALAAVLNSPSLDAGARVASSNAQAPIDLMVKAAGDSTYVFAAAMRNEETMATFTLPGVQTGARVEVIGENRVLTVAGGEFRDGFGGYDVHLYRVTHLADSR